MYGFSMLPQAGSIFPHEITLGAGIGNSQMFGLHMCFQILDSACNIVTLVTWKFHALVLLFDVRLQISFSLSREITNLALKSDAQMYSVDMVQQALLAAAQYFALVARVAKVTEFPV